MNISKMREYAFELVFETEVQKEYNEELVELFLENNEVEEKEAKKYIRKMLEGIKENEEQIKAKIVENLKSDWTIERISKINVAILKVAIYEMLFKEVPYKVAINEAIEIAKKYGDDNSPNFVNGILASVVKESENLC